MDLEGKTHEELESIRQEIADERADIMNSDDRSGENAERYEQLGREYDEVVEREYRQD